MPVGSDGYADAQARQAALCLSRLYLQLNDRVLIADPSAENRAWVREHCPGLPQEMVDPAALRAAILDRHGQALAREAVEGLGRRHPELSARRVVTRTQACLLSLLGAGLLAGMALQPLMLVRGLVLLLSAAFVVSGLFRAFLAWLGGGAPVRALPLPRCGLPRYTILVPMYREAAVMPGLVGMVRKHGLRPA